jgi:hypothetical protein
LERLDEISAAVLEDSGQQCGHVERLGGLCEHHHVVDHEGRIDVLDAAHLEWLMVDQHQGAVVRRQHRVEANSDRF